MIEVWQAKDYAERRCKITDIGQPKPAHLQPQPIPDPPPPDQQAGPAPYTPSLADLPELETLSDQEINQLSTRVLRIAAIEEFHRRHALGWLCNLTDKDFLRIVSRLMPQTIEQQITVTSNEIPAAIRSLTLDDLRAMQTAQQSGQASQIIDADFEMVQSK